MFADQFEPNEKGFVYRKYPSGAPIQISTPERDKYINAFNRYIKYSAWGLGAGTVILIFSVALYATVTDIDLPETSLFVGFGTIFIAFMSGHYWYWNLPARELRHRVPIGKARSRTEIRNLFFQNLTYGQLATGAGAGVILLLKARAGGDMLSGWNIGWTGLAVSLFLLCAIQSVRKWRFDTKRK